MVNAHLKEFHAYLPIHNTIREHWRSPSVHIALPWNIHSFRNSCENQCTSTADSILQDETARLASFPSLYTIFHSLTKLNGRSTVWNWARRGHRIRLTTGDGTQPDRAFWIYILVFNICGQCCSGGCFTRGGGWCGQRVSCKGNGNKYVKFSNIRMGVGESKRDGAVVFDFYYSLSSFSYVFIFT